MDTAQTWTSEPSWSLSSGRPRTDHLCRCRVEVVARRSRALCSFTELGGRWCLRPCWVGARSTMEDAKAFVDEVVAVSRDALQRLRGSAGRT